MAFCFSRFYFASENIIFWGFFGFLRGAEKIIISEAKTKREKQNASFYSESQIKLKPPKMGEKTIGFYQLKLIKIKVFMNC